MANNRPIGTKKSDFVAGTTLAATDTLDFVSGSTNTKITYSDFISQLGVTGSIVQTGDVLGAPVLEVSGTINGIRSIVGTSGISAVINAQNSVEISSSYSFDTTGAELVDDPNATPLVFRSIVAGSDMDVSDATAGQITVSLDRSDVVPLNRVMVNSADDFPAAVGGVRTLADNTEYYIGANNVDIGSDRFVLGVNNTISGGGTYSHVNMVQEVSRITTTNTGALFTGSECGRFTLKDVTLSFSTGSLLDIDDGPASTFRDSVIEISNVGIGTTNCSLGTVTDVHTLSVSGLLASSLTQGIALAGNINALLIEQSIIGGAICIDLGTARLTAARISKVTLSGQTGIKGDFGGGNIVADSVGEITGCEFGFTTTPLDTITTDDARWAFRDNGGIKDTLKQGLLSLTNNALATTISVASTPVLVAGTWVVQAESHFDCTVGGRAKYLSERDGNIEVGVSCSLEPASGINKDIAIYIAKNGTVVNETKIVRRTDAGNPGAVSTIWSLDIVKDDYIEVFVANDTDTVDVLVSNAVLRVR
jgi:hypothetical protein